MPPAVVVGASVAGVRVAQSLRNQGFDRPIVLLEREDCLPYDKPPLSKRGLVGPDTGPTPLLSATDLADLGVDYRPGVAAVGLDTATKTLLTSDVAVPELRYGELVLATGCVPRRLPQLDQDRHGRPRAGVHYLRTASDAAALRAALTTARRLVVVGAGLIGAEVAASARSAGRAVTVVEAGPRMAGRVLAPEPARHLLDLHRRHGVRVELDTTVAGVSGDERVEGVVLSTGETVAADVVVIGVGAVTDLAWLAGSGLSLGGGPSSDSAIHCDPSLRALGAEDVWAVGDVARWPHPHPEESGSARYEHWTSAREQAAHVAAAIVRGVSTPIAPLPYVWSDQFEVHVQHVGWRSPDVRRVEVANGGVLFEFHREGRVVGATGFDAQRAVLGVRRSLG
jgi:NADPH-dependent 2,4-dienoyl-CoA reductase/sulfur reductase-like enzyme